MRYFNYVVIVLVLVGAALWGRGSSSPLPALQADLKASLDAFWQNERSVVEVLGTPAQAEVRASVAFPPDTTPRQQQGMNAFIPFVARRHPGVKLGSVRVVPLVDNRANAAPPLEDVNQAETAQRSLQAQLDGALGAGQTLILVNAQTPPGASINQALTRRAPASNELAPPASFEGGAPAAEGKAAPALDRESARRPSQPAPPALLLAVVVVGTKADAAKASNLVGPSLNQLRVVLLP